MKSRMVALVMAAALAGCAHQEAGEEKADPKESLETGRIVPIYEAIGKLTSRWFRRAVRTGLGLNANDDTGRTEAGGLVADDGTQASSVLASTGFTKTSSGYADRSDGWSSGDAAKNAVVAEMYDLKKH